ncbi:MAG: hypothetical protein V1838_02805 [Patescibacteria group bacterium]
MRLFKRKTIQTGIIALLGTLLLLAPASVVLAFDKNMVISDVEFYNANALTLKDINYFLKQKKGFIFGYSVKVNGQSKTAAEIIYQASQEYTISPKTILVTLQKEQSLVTAVNPSTRALNYAMGYGCPDGSSCNSKAAGLFNQIDFATWQFRQYTDHPTWYTYQAGNKYSIDGETVTIGNQATANLYNYTPHIFGNKNFWTIWNNWFSVLYPDGSLLRPEGEPGIWLIKDGKKWPFHSSSAFYAKYDIEKVIDVAVGVLDAYPLGTAIEYPNMSLLQAPNSGVYLMLDNQIHPVTNRETFNNLGLNPEELILVSWEVINSYDQGNKINDVDSSPSGQLLQSAQTGAIYYVIDKQRRTIHSPQILQSQFRGQRWIKVDQSQLDSYARGADVPFRDGELITSPNADGVYFVSNGRRRPIPSYEVFLGLGFKWSNIIWTTDRALMVQPLGEKLSLIANE